MAPGYKISSVSCLYCLWGPTLVALFSLHVHMFALTRYLAKDKKNGMHQLVLGLTRRLAIMQPKEVLYSMHFQS